MSTTTHPFTPEEIMAFIDGELSADRAQCISTHIEQCPECSRVRDSLRDASTTLASWTVAAIPTRVERRVKAGSQNTLSVTSPTNSSELPRSSRWAWKQGLLAFGVSAAVLVLLFAIATPNLLRSRMAANEASAVGSLRTLNTAAVSYLSTYGHFPRTLRSFGPPSSGATTEDAAGLIDPTLSGGRKSGYLFMYHSFPGFGSSGAGTYTIRAEPVNPGDSGYRHFSTDQTGVIRILSPDGKVLDESAPSGPSSGGLASKEAQPNTNGEPETAPMIARTAELRLTVENLGETRKAMDRILGQHKGYIAELTASAESGSVHTLTASLRVPADQLDQCITELKNLGRVKEESQAGEEVTKQHADLTARLDSARTTEGRLNDVIQKRTGRVSDILEVEKESARVRGEIEQMEAEQQTLEHRVNFATIDLKFAEEYKAQLSSPAPLVGMQLRNATVNGFRNASETLLGILLLFAESGPTLLLWLLILLFPARLVWKRYRRQLALS